MDQYANLRRPNAQGGEDRRPYFINVSLTAAAGGSNTTAPVVNIGSRAFVWEQLGIMSTGDQDWRIKIRDSGAMLEFQNEPFQTQTLKGTVDEPFTLPAPWKIAANSGIYVEAYNDGAAQDTIYLTFIGYLD